MCVHECGRNGQMHGRSFGEQTTVTFECDYKCIAFCTVYTFWNRFDEMPSILLTQMFVLMSFSQSKFSSSFMRFASVCFTGRWIGRMGRLSWNDGYGNWFGKSADMITNRGGKTDTKSVDAQSENARQNWKLKLKSRIYQLKTSGQMAICKCHALNFGLFDNDFSDSFVVTFLFTHKLYTV